MRLHKEGYVIVTIAVIIWLTINYLVGLTGETVFRVFTPSCNLAPVNS